MFLDKTPKKICLGIVLSFFWVQGWSQEASSSMIQTASTFLPKETCFFLALPRPKESVTQFFKETAWGQILQQSEVRTLFQLMLEKGSLFSPKPLVTSDYWKNLKLLTNIFDRGIAFALVPSKTQAVGWLFRGEFSQESLFLEHLQKIEQWLTFSFQQERSQELCASRTISKFVLPFASCFYGYQEGRFVLSNHRELFEQAFLNQGPSSSLNTLFHQPSFQELWSRWATFPTDVFLYGQSEVLKLFQNSLWGSEKAQRLYGWEAFRTFGLWLGFQDGKVNDEFFVTFSAQKGFLGGLRTGKISLSALSFCPLNTTFFASLKCSPAKLMRLWSEISDGMAVSTKEAWLTQFQNSLKYSLIEDLFGLLGEELSLFLAFPKTGFLPEIALISPLVAEQEVLVSKLKLFLRTQDFFTLEEHIYDSCLIYSLQPKQAFGPCFFFTCLRGHFIFSYHCLTLKQVIQRLHQKKNSFMQSKILSDLDLQKTREHQGFVWLDSKQFFQFCYAPLYQMLNLFPLKTTFEAARLPDPENFSLSFDQMMTFVDFTSKSFSWSSVGDGSSLGIAFLGFLETFGATWLSQVYQQIPTEESNEKALIQMLKMLVEGETQFQYENWVDMDRDGMGEYGWIQELSGTALPRTSSKMPTQFFLPKELGLHSQKNQGIARWKGYYLLLYLPSETGIAYREPGQLSENFSATVSVKAANAQEFRWLCYAWPVSYSKIGMRSFVVNQDGAFFTASNANYHGLSQIPSPEACFNPQKVSKKQAQNIGESSQIGHGESFDGFDWIPYTP